MKRSLRSWLSASFLFLFAAGTVWAQTPAREIRVTAAVSSSFKKAPDWQKDIQQRVARANKIFEQTFGLHFSVEKYLPWEPSDENRGMPILVEELKKFPLQSGNHVVIGFHKMSQAADSEKMEDIETVGTAQFFNGYIAVRDPQAALAEEEKQIILVHEIAHLFGAVHVSGNSAIMSTALPAAPENQIDPENRQIILQTRDVDFLKGIDSLSAQTLDRLISIYEKLIRGNPHSDFYYQLGDFYRKRGLEARAIAVWEEALRYHYDNPRIHYELGVFYYKSGRYDQAVQELGSAIAHYVLDSQKKQKANVLSLLGAAYFEKGHEDQAVYAWLQGLTLDSENRDLQANLAAAYLKKGDVDRAMTELEKLHTKYPDDAAILSNLGAVAFQKKDYDKAVYYFSESLAKNPAPSKEKKDYLFSIPQWTLHLDLGAAYGQKGDWLQAQRQFEKAKLLNPANEDILRSLGRVYVMQKQFKPAISELDAALRVRADNPETHALLAQAYAESGNSAQALASAAQAIRYTSDSEFKSTLHKNRGLIYARDQNYIKALEELKLAASLHWSDPDLHYNLGVVYLNRQDIENAKRSFKTALSMKPGFQPAQDALKSLEKR